MKDLGLGLRLLGRMLRAGELTLLAVAVALAVAATATVGLFTDRTRLALEREANRLLGADLVLRWSRPIPSELVAEAQARGLKTLSTLAFRSMVGRGNESMLAEIIAVDPGYPLRGTTRIAPARATADRIPDAIPQPGTLWADERLFSRLNAQVGDRITLGNRGFVLAAVLAQDPSLTLSIMGLGPRLVMARAEVDSTGLMVPGSRAVHRVLIAGGREAIDAYRTWAEPRLTPGVRLEGLRDARPEVRAALERSERFMGLAALVAVALAAVVIMLATRRFHERQLDTCAMLRCLGSSGARVFRLQLVQLLGVGLAASALGCLAGYGAQFVLGHWLSSLTEVALPQPSLGAALRALALGVLLLLAFGLPPLLALKSVPALRVLRREAAGAGISVVAAYGLGVLCIAGLVFWHARDPRLGLYVLAGCLGTIAAAALFTWGGLRVLGAAGNGRAVSWRFGVASLRRRSAGTVWQVVALALGMAAMLTLTVVRADLLTAWKGNLPADAPNRFLINIQPDQVEGVQQLLAEQLGSRPEMFAMVRGRLVAINGRPIDPSAYGDDDRARRLVEREFNLGKGDAVPTHNRIVAGSWHGESGRAGLSVEEGIARTLGIALGDRLTYDVAGVRFEAPVTSLREVQWDSFRVNFFVIASDRLLAAHPSTHITSFYLPAGRQEVLNSLVQRFPTVVVIDVASLLTQVQAMIAQVSRAISFIFVFTLAAGILALYAGIVATHDERVREVAILRTLGANRGQVARAHAAEFAIIGALAGLFAAAGANGLGLAVALNVLHLPYRFDPQIWMLGFGIGVVGVLIVGMAFTRRVLRTPPLASLRQLG